MERRIEAVSAGVKVSSPVSIGTGSKPPATDLHPVVAALKAELAGLPVTLGTPVPMGPSKNEEAPVEGVQASLATLPPTVHTFAASSARPDTVIVGGMPVLRKEQEKAQESKPPEKSSEQQA